MPFDAALSQQSHFNDLTVNVKAIFRRSYLHKSQTLQAFWKIPCYLRCICYSKMQR
ncbi:hypothetical protein T4C_9149 [Trichinella pseudospiralis]|uniref:Uncharacterized protein n=1 Tax=Trichinella pseudospiralis TaxID=6337 RepID=A0A0V1K530_TRIPS|nr:hypothetical protein T4C_9149 [Trichinella pseudospiralis]